MQTWQIQEAKNRLSEVVDKALGQGPQVITRRGVETAVVLSFEEYRRLRRPENDLVDFFQASPLVGVDVDLERSRDAGPGFRSGSTRTSGRGSTAGFWISPRT